jgi:hypothetical protein
MARPTSSAGSGPSFGTNSPAPSVASTTKLPGHGGPRPPEKTQHPSGKTAGQGPATFEEMGIPQGKNDGDCVSFFVFVLFLGIFDLMILTLFFLRRL